MASRTGRSVTTKQGALEKVRENLDRLTTREANLIRMRYGIAEKPESPVGDPPRFLSSEARRRIRAIEQLVLDRARGKRPYSQPTSTKQKIIQSLKKKD